MAPLPKNESLTLRAIWEAWEKQKKNYDSIGIGMSALGSECDRQIWMDFRWASPPENLSGQKLRLFETGNEQERRMIADLRRVPGVTVWDKDQNTGKQFAVYSHGGHVRGRLDGVAIGLPDAPATVHVVEFKSHNRKNFEQLVKQGVRKAKWAHFLQCQKYMQLESLTRCLYMAVCKDNDDLYLERIEYDAVEIAKLDARLDKIIGYNRAPSRIADSADKYPCMFCRHKDACHGYDFGRLNCRTCVHSTPVITEGNEAVWTCAKHNKRLTVEEQRAGCEFHLFLPDLVPGEQVDAGDDWVAYKMRNGETWVNQEKKAATKPEQIAPKDEGTSLYAMLKAVADGHKECEVCYGSKIENIDGGNGTVIEAPCSRCQVQKHDFYKTGDKDAPEQIKDRNGEVVLQCCRRCGRAEREIKSVDEPCVPPRYWWHAESGSAWKTEDGKHPYETHHGVAGEIEELTLEEYEQACAWLAQKEHASQLGIEHRLNADGICENCLADSKCLPTHCPNHEINFDQMAGIQNKVLDYKNGQWFDPTAKAEAAE